MNRDPNLTNNSQSMQHLVRKAIANAKADIAVEKWALKKANLKSGKHIVSQDILHKNLYQNKRQAEFAPDFSI